MSASGEPILYEPGSTITISGHTAQSLKGSPGVTWIAAERSDAGSGAAGVQASGYPNLLDDDWLWGGSIEEIHYTVANGIRNESDDAHFSEMPAFNEILEEEEIGQVVQYVLKLSGQDADAGLAAAGEGRCF